MNVMAAIGMYQRRGTRVGWLHAEPPDESTLNPLTRGPRAPLGGPRADPFKTGAFGESYSHPEVGIRAYAHGKISSATLALYGVVEAGDMELVVLVPFQPDPASNILALPEDLLEVYNAGRFIAIRESKTTIAADRFRFLGALWVAKAPSIPMIDGDVVFGYRVLVTKVTT